MHAKTFLRPFERIAGGRALLFGLAGIVLSILSSVATGFKLNGLLQYRLSVDVAWWSLAAEHLVVWLIPALLFWGGGLILSKSRIRLLDVLGTTAFAQLPLLPMIWYNMLPPIRSVLLEMDAILRSGNLPSVAWMSQAQVQTGMLLMIVGIVFMVWMLIWMYNALRVSCNLKGGAAVGVYVVGVVIGDLLCRIVIGLLA